MAPTTAPWVGLSQARLSSLSLSMLRASRHVGSAAAMRECPHHVVDCARYGRTDTRQHAHLLEESVVSLLFSGTPENHERADTDANELIIGLNISGHEEGIDHTLHKCVTLDSAPLDVQRCSVDSGLVIQILYNSLVLILLVR